MPKEINHLLIQYQSEKEFRQKVENEGFQVIRVSDDEFALIKNTKTYICIFKRPDEIFELLLNGIPMPKFILYYCYTAIKIKEE